MRLRRSRKFPYQGWLYLALIFGCISATDALVVGSDTRAWLGSMLLPGGAAFAFFDGVVCIKDLAQELGDPPGMGSVNTELKVLERAQLLTRAPRDRGEGRVYLLGQPSAYWRLCQELRDQMKVDRATRQETRGQDIARSAR